MGGSVFKGVAWLSISRITIQLYNFITTLYIARVLGPSDYSLAAIGMMVIAFMEKFSELGFGMAIVQKEELSDSELHTIYWCTVLTGMLVSILCYFTAPFMQLYFAKKGVQPIIETLSICLCVQSISIVPFKLMERHLKFKKTAVVEMSSKVTSLTFSILFIYFGFGVWSLVYGQVIRVLTFSILAFVMNPFCPKFTFKFEKIKETIGFGLSVVGLRFAWYGRNQIDLFLGARYLSSWDFGYYSFAFQLVRPFQDIIQGVMSTVSVPVLARSQNSNVFVNETYLKIISYAMLIACPLFVGGAILGEQIIFVALGAKWLPAVPFFKAACLVILLRLLIAPNEDLLLAIGKLSASLKINLAILTFISVIMMFFMPRGAYAMVYSLVASMLFVYLLWTFLLIRNRSISLTVYWINIRGVVQSVLVMAVSVAFFKSILLGADLGYSKMLVGGYAIVIILVGLVMYMLSVMLFDKTLFARVLASKSRSV